MRRTLDLVRPRLFIMMETEIWPVLLRECRQRGVKTAVVNGRLSSRSYPALPARSGRSCAACSQDIDRFCVQSDESARRFIELGADPGRVVVTGVAEVRLARRRATAAARARDRVLRYFRLPAVAAGASSPAAR